MLLSRDDDRIISGFCAAIQFMQGGRVRGLKNWTTTLGASLMATKNENRVLFRETGVVIRGSKHIYSLKTLWKVPNELVLFPRLHEEKPLVLYRAKTSM